MSEDFETKREWAMTGAALLLALATAGAIWTTTVMCMEKRAIEANVAEWRIDPKTGASEFAYLTCECEELSDAD